MTVVEMVSLSGRGNTRSFADAQDDRGAKLNGLSRSFEGRGLFLWKSLIDFARWVQCTLVGPSSMTVRQQILLLAQFAFYCGIGYKTAMGMGQVRLRSEKG